MEEQRKSGQKKKETMEQPSAQTPRVMKVGEMLQAAREGKGKSVEDISAVINIRVAQLKALESGNVDALPGMTYAHGFVRSYANYLGLDSVELLRQFKQEHSEASEKPDLHFPAPVAESHLPSPMVLAAAGGAAVLLLIVWAFLASWGHDDGNPVTAEVPAMEAPATADATSTSTPTPVETASALTSSPALQETPPPVATAETQVPVVPQTTPVVLPGVPVNSAVSVPSAVAVVAPTPVPVGTGINSPAAAPSLEIVASPAPEETAAPPLEVDRSKIVQKPKNLLETAGDFGAVSRSGSRVTLQAVKPSWIQITTGKDAIVFKKVLQPGEKYNVPTQDEPLYLITSNAGGLEVYVDGKRVQDVGDEGEIVRGVSLNPKDLSLQRIRMNRR